MLKDGLDCAVGALVRILAKVVHKLFQFGPRLYQGLPFNLRLFLLQGLFSVDSCRADLISASIRFWTDSFGFIVTIWKGSLGCSSRVHSLNWFRLLLLSFLLHELLLLLQSLLLLFYLFTLSSFRVQLGFQGNFSFFSFLFRFLFLFLRLFLSQAKLVFKFWTFLLQFSLSLFLCHFGCLFSSFFLF